jgi:hypothetical protein
MFDPGINEEQIALHVDNPISALHLKYHGFGTTPCANLIELYLHIAISASLDM